MNTKAIFTSAILFAALLAGGCAYPAYVAGGPPPPRAEVIPASPGAGYYWVAGHWAWRYGRYVWIRGHWIARAGSAWVPGHYVNQGGVYVWVGGHWQ